MGKPDWTFANERWLLSGPSGCGKTTLALSLVAKFAHGRFVFCFDQKGELARRLRIPPAFTLGQMATQIADRGIVAYSPHVMFAGATARGFEWFSGAVWNASHKVQRETVFVVDELQDFVGPGRREIPPPLASIVESGRGWKIHTVAIAQSANLVNARLRQQFNRVAVFRQSEQTAVAPLAAWGFDPGAVAALPRLTAIVRNRDTGAEQMARITWSQRRAAVTLSER